MDGEGSILARFAEPAEGHNLKELIPFFGPIFSMYASKSAVRIPPGAIQLTWMFAPATSNATLLVSDTTAALLALYPGLWPLITEMPPVEAMLMIFPYFFGSMILSASRVHQKHSMDIHVPPAEPVIVGEARCDAKRLRGIGVVK